MKTILHTITRYLAMLAVVFGTVSCLDKYPETSIPEKEAMKTFADAEQHLIGIYANLMSSSLYSGLLTLLPDIQSDLVQAVKGNSNTYGNFWLWNIRPTDLELEAVYAQLYTVIGGCNFYLDRIDEVRAQEGTTLIADLLRRIDRIEQIKNEIEPYEKARTETIKARIREHVESLGIPYDAGRLEQEMIYYIEKLDITEEKVRLQNHCRYFREVAHAEQGAGRKLGFIAQELGREINTLGSKSNEATMQKMVVEMKDELEKIKEQVLNIL